MVGTMKSRRHILLPQKDCLACKISAYEDARSFWRKLINEMIWLRWKWWTMPRAVARYEKAERRER